MNSIVYEYLVASGRVDPLFPEQAEEKLQQRKQAKQAQTFFLPADPEAVWGTTGDGKRILASRVEMMIDAGEITFLKREPGGMRFFERPASLQEMRLHLLRLSAKADAEQDEARKFSLQARRDLAFKAICQRAAQN